MRPFYALAAAAAAAFAAQVGSPRCLAGAAGLAPAPTQAPAQASPPAALPPLVLTPAAKLGPGASKEISGIVKSRAHPGVYWTLNDSGDEPRVYPIREDGSVVPSVRYPETPGVLVAGAINSDWEDIAVDASGRLIVADFGNNTNARADLTLYLLEEPEADEGRAGFTSKIVFRYPDQRARPAPKADFNFDAEALFTVGDDIFILSKNRSDTFTKLYRVDAREPGVVNTLTYLDRFDVLGQATGADCTPDGLRLAILTYDRIWLFERADIRTPFFSGRVRCRPYRMVQGDSDSESICFADDQTLLVADESRAELYRVPLAEIPEVRPAAVVLPGPSGPAEGDLRVMSFNLRYASARDGENAWPLRRDLVAGVIASCDPDLLGAQEVEALQADWLRERFPTHGFHGVGRLDGARAGEFAPILYRAERFVLLAGGHFWLSPTPEVPGSRGWDAACERMASWVRLHDRRTGGTLLVLNTHLDHVGVQARTRSAELIRARLDRLAAETASTDGGATPAVVVLGDFNVDAGTPVQVALLGDSTTGRAGGVALRDTYRRIRPARDAFEGTFSGWTADLTGDRIDWILASQAYETVSAGIERRVQGRRTASDHYPVTAVLRPLQPGRP